jgi:hypothetical protein
MGYNKKDANWQILVCVGQNTVIFLQLHIEMYRYDMLLSFQKENDLESIG